MNDPLFQPLQAGALHLPNRVVMAPLTRCRASAGRVPNAMMARYYAQRSSFGLILSEATAVTSGDWHVCALVKDGQVACVGDNSHGQLGDGTTTDSKTPKLVPQLTGMTQLGAGDTFTCALHGTGQVVCWGAWRVKDEE